MSVDVIVPFAGSCPHRQRALDWTTGQYRTAGWNVIVGSGDAGRWCKADAVADALRRSDADILVIADADVWTDELAQAVTAVQAGAGWAIPHWNVLRLTDDGTTAFLAGEREQVEIEEKHTGAPAGGIVVLPRATYDRMPLDPRFIGWFGEDRSWAYALRTLVGEVARFQSPLWHLWHPPQARRSRTRGSPENQALCARYFECLLDVDAMRSLVEEVTGNSGDRGFLHDAGHGRQPVGGH
jgi:hypothetical protein